MNPSGTRLRLSDAERAEFGPLVSAYAARRAGWVAEAPVDVLSAEVLVEGRPGVVDVVARLGERTVHVTFGLRAADDVGHLPRDGEDVVVGTIGGGADAASVFDATRDGDLTASLLRVVAGEDVDPARVRHLREDEASQTVVAEDRMAFTVYNEVVDGPRPELELFLALDEAGFNHLAAPLAMWRDAGRDLGVLQEYLPGMSSGYALAMTSVRDLYASGGPPELAGGDFGAEAHRLGTMAARMHVGLDRAFGRHHGDVARWAEQIEAFLGAHRPDALDRPDVQQLLGELRALVVRALAIRTHGDFHLGRTGRNEQGWYVVDFGTGRPPSSVGAVVDDTSPDPPGPAFRSPLGDVADMLWSFGRVASSAADERDPSGRDGLGELARAWEARNRRAFLAGYLGVPGITALLPAGREALRVITDALELVRGALDPPRRPGE